VDLGGIGRRLVVRRHGLSPSYTSGPLARAAYTAKRRDAAGGVTAVDVASGTRLGPLCIGRAWEFFRNAWDMRELRVKGLTIPHTAAQELRPRWYGELWIELFWQQAPQVRMVPTQLMFSAVAMRADAGAQLLHLRDEFVSGELVEIVVQVHLPSS
jgi:hypothetical protein